MPLLTVFSAPKPFTDPHIAVIQRNAIRSWTLLPDTEVLLVGDERGLAEVAGELGLRQLPEVTRNDQGTPLISSIFAQARLHSNSACLAYVNADIILMSDFVKVAREVMDQKRKFLLVGQRWDLEVLLPLDFSGDWEDRLRDAAQSGGKLHRPSGSDYFIYPRECFMDIPDFAVGRAGWDNWMIYKARKERWAAIDASAEITIIHQKHDYAHLPGGQRHHRLPESAENLSLGGGSHVKQFRLRETNHVIVHGHVRRKPVTWNRVREELAIAPYVYTSSKSLQRILASALSYFLPRKTDKRRPSGGS
jgi:hypothetical protein